MHKNLTDAKKAFLKQLPKPNETNVSAILEEMIVEEQKVRFMAQKTKGKTGFAWDVYPLHEN